MTIAVTVTVTDQNGQQVQSTGGGVTPGSISPPMSVKIGETNVLTAGDSNNANLILAQQITLSQASTIQSMSFYVTIASEQLRLGIYTDVLGSPGSKLAETNAFTPIVGWNTQATTTTPTFQAGTYWIAYLPQSNTLAFVKGSGVGIKWASTNFDIMPAIFPTSTISESVHFSFYATFTQSGQTQTTWINSDPIPQTGFTVVLSNASLSNLGAQNKGAVIGAVTVVNGVQTSPVVIGGQDAAKFAVTNGGMVPCNLIAVADIPAGSYNITLTAA